MSTVTDINRQFLSLVNDETQKLVAAREQYPEEYVDSYLLPTHEQRLQKLVTWREMQLKRVSAFSEQPDNIYGQGRRVQGYVRGFAAVPGRVTTQFDQAYNAQAAVYLATYKAALQSAKDGYNTTIAQLKAQLQQANIGATAVQKRANQAQYNAGVVGAKQALNQANATAKGNYQSALSQLSGQLIGLLGQSTYYNPNQGLSPIQPTGTPILSPASPSPVYSLPPTGPYDPSQPYQDPNSSYYSPPPVGDNFGPDDTTVFPGSSSAGSVIPGYVAPSLDVPQDPWGNGGSSEFSLTPGYGPASVQPVIDVESQTSPDWYGSGSMIPGWGFSESPPISDHGIGFADCDGGFMGNSTIRALNRMSCIPASTYGFSQWAQIATAVTQAAAQIGSTVLSAKLAPKPAVPKNTSINLATPAAGGVNPWLVGGAVAAGALVLVLLLRRK